MYKYANPLFYFRKLYRMWYLRFAHDPSAIAAEEGRKLTAFGDIGVASDRLNGILAARGRGPYDPDDDSVHLLLWSLLSLRHPVKRILEIGTFEGEGTNILARLFPAAEVTTVELPDDDPLFRTFYRRSSDAERKAFHEKQEKNLDLPNITLLKANSFFLPRRLEGAFDLIWIDGGHLYPEVAWDICNAWHLAAPGGAILLDDVVTEKNSKKTGLISSESYEVLEYLQERIPALDLKLFLKRRFPFRGMDVLKKTSVAVITKPTNA
jgi:predicted O-methyltransferase YrrM